MLVDLVRLTPGVSGRLAPVLSNGLLDIFGRQIAVIIVSGVLDLFRTRSSNGLSSPQPPPSCNNQNFVNGSSCDVGTVYEELTTSASGCAVCQLVINNRSSYSSPFNSEVEKRLVHRVMPAFAVYPAQTAYRQFDPMICPLAVATLRICCPIGIPYQWTSS